jgi:hypothetical protein
MEGILEKMNLNIKYAALPSRLTGIAGKAAKHLKDLLFNPDSLMGDVLLPRPHLLFTQPKRALDFLFPYWTIKKHFPVLLKGSKGISSEVASDYANVAKNKIFRTPRMRAAKELALPSLFGAMTVDSAVYEPTKSYIQGDRSKGLFENIGSNLGENVGMLGSGVLPSLLMPESPFLPSKWFKEFGQSIGKGIDVGTRTMPTSYNNINKFNGGPL